MNAIAHNERDHIRMHRTIIEDMSELTDNNLKFADCLLIEDHEGATKAHHDELHSAFVVYAHMVDYIRSCNLIDTATRSMLVHQFSDIIDSQEHPVQAVDKTK